MEFFSNRIMPILLLGLFTKTWSMTDPVLGPPLEYMLLWGGVISFPFFFLIFLEAVIGGKMVAGCLLILGIIFPPLLILLTIWILISLLAKFASLIENLPLLLGGLVLLGISWLVPGWLYGVMDRMGWSVDTISLLIALSGALLFAGYLIAARAAGYRPGITSALALGSVCYLTLFAVTLLLPGHADVGDADVRS